MIFVRNLQSISFLFFLFWNFAKHNMKIQFFLQLISIERVLNKDS